MKDLPVRSIIRVRIHATPEAVRDCSISPNAIADAVC